MHENRKIFSFLSQNNNSLLFAFFLWKVCVTTENLLNLVISDYGKLKINNKINFAHICLKYKKCTENSNRWYINH